MNARTSYGRIMTMAQGIALVMSVITAQAQSGGAAGAASGSSGPAVGGTHGRTQPGRPATRGTDSSKQTQDQTASDKMQALEHRLRDGQMEQPIAQGQISSRLDQFYQGAEKLHGDSSADQPPR